MPHICFINDPQQGAVPVGYVERVCVYSPWTQNQRAQNGATVNPIEAAWYALQQLAQKNGWVFSPGVDYKPMITNKATDMGNEFKCYCVQFAQPSVERAQVNAPYGVPHGNGRQLTMPPVATKERSVAQGLYEQIDQSALPANAGDGLMAEMDGEGGTWTDLDSLGNEVVRHELMPQGVPVQQRQ